MVCRRHGRRIGHRQAAVCQKESAKNEAENMNGLEPTHDEGL